MNKIGYITVFISTILLSIGCLTTRIYYPYFSNGYEEEINVKIIFKDGEIYYDKFSSTDGFVMMNKGRAFDSIEVYDKNGKLITSYSSEYLDNLRKECGGAKELYIVYEGGIVLISENCPINTDWRIYIRNLKTKK